MEEIKDFIEKLRDERNEINNKLRFVHEHKFTKEADYLREKVSIINTIMYELESVADGNTKGINCTFLWM